MKRLLSGVLAFAAVLALAGVAMAGMAAMNGEVTKYEAGKTIAVKDAGGKEHALEISKDTKIEGDVKVGTKVSVEADGKKAHSIKAAAGG